MQLKVHAPDQPEIRKLTLRIQHELELVLSRCESQVVLVTAWLQDLDGLRGDKRCFLRAKLVQGKDICLEADDTTMEVAINSATARLGRSVLRALRESGITPATQRGPGTHSFGKHDGKRTTHAR